MARHIRFLAGLALLLILQTPATSHRLPDSYRFRATNDQIQGYWKVVASEYNARVENPHRENTGWKITKDQIIILIDNQDRGRWNYTFTPASATQTPAGIDLNPSSVRGLIYPSIYELKGDELRICICQFPERGVRANEFRTDQNSVYVLYVLKRAPDR